MPSQAQVVDQGREGVGGGDVDLVAGAEVEHDECRGLRGGVERLRAGSSRAPSTLAKTSGPSTRKMSVPGTCTASGYTARSTKPRCGCRPRTAVCGSAQALQEQHQAEHDADHDAGHDPDEDDAEEGEQGQPEVGDPDLAQAPDLQRLDHPGHGVDHDGPERGLGQVGEKPVRNRMVSTTSPAEMTNAIALRAAARSAAADFDRLPAGGSPAGPRPRWSPLRRP